VKRAAGNRKTVAELSGRTVQYGYDSLYRLNSETVTVDPASQNGLTTYNYDAVGNRQVLKINGVTVNTYNYDANDRLTSDVYDNDGNTTSSVGISNAYDFENHLIQHGAVTIVYDGDGNRVAETVGGVTTKCLVDTQNPTGYAQVVDELVGSAVTRTYSYGLERINENQLIAGNWQPSFYGYDGHGSVRQLFNSGGVATDTYDYDAFGNLVSSTGSTPNNYLFAGEQFDPALNLYYNRARYLNTTTGRFWDMDTYEGHTSSPSSLHQYLFTNSDPVNGRDPSGHEDLAEIAIVLAVSATLSLNALTFATFLNNTAAADSKIDGGLLSFRFNVNAIVGTLGAGFDVVYDGSQFWWALSEEFGIAPLSIFSKQRNAGLSLAAGSCVWFT